jgi:sulfur-oxidizing protein SoxA
MESRLSADLHATLQGFNADEISRTPFGRGEMANVTALATWVSSQSKGMAFNLPQSTQEERVAYEVGKRLFFQRGGTHDFSCASCHGEEGKRIRLQDLPNLTKNPGDGIGFAAWPAYRVSNGQMWSMQLRLNDCYRQQRFPDPGFGSGRDRRFGCYMGVNAKGAKSVAPLPSSAEGARGHHEEVHDCTVVAGRRRCGGLCQPSHPSAELDQLTAR